MIRVGDLSIRVKLTLVILLTCTAALLLATGSFVAYDIARFRRELVDKTESLAGVTGHNTTAALEFNDPKSAADTLTALRDEPHLVAAYIFDRDRHLFASFIRADAPTPPPPPPADNRSHEFSRGHLVLYRPILSQHENVGTIALVSDLGGLSERLQRYAVIVVSVFTAALGLVLLLSVYFERWLTRPLVRLAQLARVVAVEKNYSTRARKTGDDEIGQLVDGFNDMLAQIQARDAELQQAQALLERRVEERTAALKQAQEKAAREQARFKFIFDSLPVGVTWMVVDDLPTRIINPSFARLTGVPVDSPKQLERCRAATHPDDLARHDELHRQLLAREIEGYEVEQRYVQSDGSVRSTILAVRLFHDATTSETQEIQTLVDITERQKSAAEREALNRQLVDASRQAGMAEVATGILHNVGNVLNSVNISAQLLRERLAQSQLTFLVRTADLVRAQGDQFARFVTEDPKGRLVPGFLLTVTSALVKEHEALAHETDQLSRNVEHIKGIVSAQQNFAKLGGVNELLDASVLFNEAVGLAQASLLEQRVQIERDFHPCPPLFTDRHRTLQILVNFLTNAIHAVRGNPLDQRRITLRVTHHKRRVVFSVADNGVGISAENLHQIFTQGFTTRHDGHGFGLHSGALAAQLLGGRVRVRSDGLGRGATFTLELPARPERDPSNLPPSP